MRKNWLLAVVFGLFIFSCASNPANEEILKSNNIQEIEKYLSQAHPEDPKRRILKQHLIAIKNAEWTKGRKDAKPMEARPLFFNLPDLASAKKNTEARDELFRKLMTETPEEHQEKTVKLLNTLFNKDINSNEVILLIKNNSDCNLVLEISGKKFYNLPVPSKGENSIVLNKDNYSLSGSLCDVMYQNKKEINKSFIMVLNNPGYNENIDRLEKSSNLKSTVKKRNTSKSKRRA